ncbi:MAG: ATP-binding protein [Elusimicrobiota bacterium]
MKLNSIKFKVTILYSAVLAAMLIAFSAFLYWSLYNTLYNEFDKELLFKAEGITGTITEYLDLVGYDNESHKYAAKRTLLQKAAHPEQDKIDETAKESFIRADRYDLMTDYICLLSSDGDPVTVSDNLAKDIFPIFLKKAGKLKSNEKLFKTIVLNNRRLRLIIFPYFYKDSFPFFLYIGSSVKPVIDILHNRLKFIGISIIVLLSISLFIGNLFVKSILNPVLDVTNAANKVSNEDFSARVKTGYPDEEMKLLAGTFNDMISRLEKSFRYISEFSSNVSHELKTPLAIMRGESELLLRKERSIEDYKDNVKSNLEEIRRMIRIIDDIRLFSKIQFQPNIYKFEKINLIQFMKELHKQSSVLAQEKNITVNLSLPDPESIEVDADNTHLKRLFYNIINNSVKFTPPDGRIEICVELSEGKVRVSIADTGVGIREEELPLIFNKFFYKKNTEFDTEPGSGLGLTIVKAIAEAHKGEIKAESRYGKGTKLILTLPLA